MTENYGYRLGEVHCFNGLVHCYSRISNAMIIVVYNMRM